MGLREGWPGSVRLRTPRSSHKRETARPMSLPSISVLLPAGVADMWTGHVDGSVVPISVMERYAPRR